MEIRADVRKVLKFEFANTVEDILGIVFRQAAGRRKHEGTKT